MLISVRFRKCCSSYMLDQSGGGGLAKVPPTVPMGGIARYNQSIVSGMLSMGQPMAGQPPAVPFGKQPIEPELQPAAQQDNLMSAEGGDNPSVSGRKKVLANAHGGETPNCC